jgi:hypothetical protein
MTGTATRTFSRVLRCWDRLAICAIPAARMRDTKVGVNVVHLQYGLTLSECARHVGSGFQPAAGFQPASGVSTFFKPEGHW